MKINLTSVMIEVNADVTMANLMWSTIILSTFKSPIAGTIAGFTKSDFILTAIFQAYIYHSILLTVFVVSLYAVFLMIGPLSLSFIYPFLQLDRNLCFKRIFELVRLYLLFRIDLLV
jgi:hypothetical protein